MNRLGVKISERYRPLKPLFQPTFAAIEPTFACDLDCLICQRKTMRRKKLSLDLADFKRILAKLPYLFSINLQGFGEPFLCQDLFTMIDYAAAKGIRVYTFSNGNFDPRIIPDICNSRLSELILSLDGATESTYEQIRRRASWERLTDNIRQLFSSRQDHLTLRAWIVPNQLNFEELAETVEYAKLLGFHKISIQSKLSVFSFKPEHYQRIKKIVISDQTKLAEKLQAIQNKHPEVEIVKDAVMSRQHPCRWPWNGLFISTDGDVVPCCILSDPALFSAGNIFAQPFKEIWHGEKMVQLRDSLNKSALPFFCRDCYR
jgi:radical SAM protein with 4Fe4S-binding SPASM domain